MNNTQETKAKRLLKNTILLYFRMFITMAIGLYTSRVVLNTLGIEDYGIYNAVGGMVGLFGVISGSLSAAISRDITYELGTGNLQKLKEIFSTSVIMQLILSGIIILIGECVGLPFLNYKMTIPEGRLMAAHFVLQFSILTFVIDLISVPYNACIIAHEKMNAFAYISVLDVVLKLVIVYLLKLFQFDKLKLYSLLMFNEAFIMRIIYGAYCKKKFKECSFHFVWNKDIVMQMFGFAGWNFTGAAAAVLSNSGVNLLLNIFFGPVVNAARGISNSVNNAVTAFVNNFMTALNPQITKAYAEGEQDYLYKIVNKGSKYSFYLIYLISLPIILNTQFILKLWLKQVPEYACIFVQLALLLSMIESLSNPIVTLMLATGKIKNYCIVVGTINILNFPICYISLKFGLPVISVYIIAIFISLVALIARLVMITKITNFSISVFISQVLIRIICVVSFSFIFAYLAYSRINMINESARFLLSSLISVFVVSVCILIFGIDKVERAVLKNKMIIRKKKTRKIGTVDCSGCSLCKEICPVNAIELVENKINKFLYPKIDGKKCLNCNICEKNCPINIKLDSFKDNEPIFKAYSKDITVLKKSSSGGIFYEIAKKIIKDKGIVYGHIYNNKRVVCERIEKVEDLYKAQGSKYVQSDISLVFKKIEEDLSFSRKVLFSGTPCQVMAVKRFCQAKHLDENLYTIDIVCHGVSSPAVFLEYFNLIESEKRNKIKTIEFKNKDLGWTNPQLKIEFSNGVIEKKNLYSEHYIDLYEIKNLILRESCYKCSFSGKERIGDITLGDFWSKELLSKEEENNGVSLIKINSEKGNELFASITENLFIKEYLTKNLTLNEPLWKCVDKPKNQKLFLFILSKLGLKNTMRILYGSRLSSKVIRVFLRLFLEGF